MDVLKEGTSGPQVLELQSRLRDKGFSPGAIDGSFGPGTEAAVWAFQKSEGLLSDGVVGPKTALALGFEQAALPPANDLLDIPIAVVAKMFPVTPLGNIKANLGSVLEALKQQDLMFPPVALAALATIRAETEGFVPISEGESRFNTSPNGKPFDLYDNRKDLGNKGPNDGEMYRGRGFVQLTGRANYEKFGPVIGVPTLAATPELANDRGVASHLLAAFIKDKEIAIKQALLDDDLAAARKLVNGGSHGLDRFTDAYRTGQRLLSA